MAGIRSTSPAMIRRAVDGRDLARALDAPLTRPLWTPNSSPDPGISRMRLPCALSQTNLASLMNRGH